jgi:hypothetical protein
MNQRRHEPVSELLTTLIASSSILIIGRLRAELDVEKGAV